MTTAISEFGAVALEMTSGYLAKITLVPPGLDEGDPIREQFDDRSIGVAHDMGSVWIDVVDPSRGSAFVAQATFAAGDLVRCDGIEVGEVYWRKKVATTLYQWASCIFDAPAAPSTILSPFACKFWAGRSQILCSHTGEDCLRDGAT